MDKGYSIKILSYFSITIVSLFFLYNVYTGIITKPSEGDSVNYHIPVANYYLTGQIFSPPDKNMIIRWYPSASESILALFILLHIPLNLYNMLASLILLITCYKLGNYFFENSHFSIIFATNIISLYGVQRLQHTQNIDIWLSIFFILSFFLLLNPQKRISYFLKLGFCLGMIIGSKYSGPMWAFAIILVYGKRLIPYLNLKRIIIFTIPILILGISWYMRNLIITGSPIYPQGFFFLSGYIEWKKNNFSFMNYPMWKSFVNYPYLTISAFISEYMMWTLNIIAIPLIFVFAQIHKTFINFKAIKDMLFLTVISYIFFFILPGGSQYEQIVLGMRYSYGPLILSILCIFLLSMRIKLTNLLCYIIAANTLIIFLPSYHPKVLIVVIPMIIISYFILKNWKNIIIKIS